MKIAGYEKFWNALFGAPMAAAATTLVYALVARFTGLIEMPSGEMIAAAIGALVAGVFVALNVFMTATTTPSGSPTAADPAADTTATPPTET